VSVPLAFVAVITYVVVTVGFTTRDPFKSTVPIPWSMLTPVAFVLVHLNVDEEPWLIVPGSAVNVTVGSPFTVTVTSRYVVPDPFVAVSLYVVVAVGATNRVPVVVSTVPMPWSMLTDAALATVQLNVVALP